MTMVLPTAVQAQAQQAVYAREGQTLGDVELSTGGRLILDISRVDPQTGALNLAENGGNPPVISGTLDADAAANSLWLIATQSQTRRLVNPTVTLNGANAGFENGIVYEAYGQDTLLTLAAPLRPSGDPTSRLTTVRLAGNGTINFASGIETGNSTAIKVEQELDRGLAWRGCTPPRSDRLAMGPRHRHERFFRREYARTDRRDECGQPDL